MTGVLKKEFLTKEDVEETLVNMRAMTKQKLVLAGGIAMQLYGSDRFTKDIDFLAEKIPSKFEVERKLSFGGAGGRVGKKKIPVCIVVRNDEYKKLYEDAFEKSIAGVISPEHLAVIKMAAGRGKDEEDLRILLRLKALSLPKARKIAGNFLGPYGLSSFNSFVDEVEWRRSRGEE